MTIRKYELYDDVYFKIYLHVMFEAREVLEVEVEVDVEVEVCLSSSSPAEMLLHSYRTGCTCSLRNCRVEIKHRRYPDSKL